jgi:hypothetical protein
MPIKKTRSASASVCIELQLKEAGVTTEEQEVGELFKMQESPEKLLF